MAKDVAKQSTINKTNEDDVKSLKKFIQENVEAEVWSNLRKPVGEAEQLGPEGINLDRAGYTKIFLQRCAENELIAQTDFGKEFDDLDKDKLLELSEEALPFHLDESSKEVYFIKDDNQKVLLDMDINYNDSIATSSIASLLPEVKFDVAQAGIFERMIEAEAAYKVIVINNIFKRVFNARIAEILQSYDFKELSGKKSFTELLKDIIENSTAEVRMLIAACNLKLTEIKTKKELQLYASLSQQENQELTELNLKLLDLKVSKEAEIRSEVSPGKRMILRESLVKDEENLIDSSRVAMLYRILKLNANAINSTDKFMISNLAKTMAYKIKEIEKLDERASLVKAIEKKLKRRASRIYILELKEHFMQRLRNGESFTLPSFQ